MKLSQLCSVVAYRSGSLALMTALVCASASALSSTLSSAQVLTESKMEVGLTPTLQIVPEKLAGNSVWAGGFTATFAYRLHQMVAVEAAMMGAYAPQLNFKGSSTLNSINTSVAAELHQPSAHPWDPYLSLGIGHASFRYNDPPDGFSDNSEYMYKRGAVGVRYTLSHRINWRAEMSRQFSSFGASNTFMSGLQLRIHEKVKK